MTRQFLRIGRGLAAATILVLALPAIGRADTLREVLADAYRNSHLLDQSRYLLRVEDEGVNQAAAALLPTLDFVASTSRDLVEDTSVTTMRLLGEVTLYQGGARVNARLGAQEAVAAARQQLVSLEQQVLLDAVTAYLEVWKTAQIVGVRERNVRVLTEQLRAAQDRFEVGEDTRTDVAQAQSQLANARSALAAAQGGFEIARELFNLAVGRYPDGLSDPGGLPRLPASEEEARRLAQQTHPAILARQHEVSAAEFAVAEAQGASRPRVTLDLSVGNTVQATNPALEGESASIGLTLTQPIYRGGQIASFERQALAQVQAVRFGLNQQVLLNLQAVGNAYARLAIAAAQIQATDQRIRAAQLAFDGVREEAALGARTTLDVLDAEQELLEARISRIEAQADLYAASYGILSATGLMTVAHLNLPVPEYDVAAYPAAFPGGRPRVASPQGERLETLLQAIGRE